MVTYESSIPIGNGTNRVIGECLSTDEKPTHGIANGSKLREMDTQITYRYDEANAVWRVWTAE